MPVCHIVAASENNVIGMDNQLPWDIPEDVKFFKDKTLNSIVIMGRKTFESLGKPLPKRLNIVITRQANYTAPGALVVQNLTAAMELARKHAPDWGPEIFIIGGGEIYSQSMNLVDRIYLTRIHAEFTGDAKYPKVDEKQFKLVDKQPRQEPVPFDFLTYDRK